MILEEKILTAISGLSDKMIEQGVFVEGAQAKVMNYQSDGTGADLVFRTGKATLSSGDIDTVLDDVRDLFDGDLFVSDYTLAYVRKSKTMLLTVNMVCGQPVKYDYSEADKYLQGVCPPSVISGYIEDALVKLWSIHNLCTDIHGKGEVFGEFDNVAATLKICKRVMDGVKIVGVEE